MNELKFLDPFWNDIFYRFDYQTGNTHYPAFVPDGYELVETQEHKRERLQKEIEEKRASVAYLTKHLAELSQQIEAEEKDLLALKP